MTYKMLSNFSNTEFQEYDGIEQHDMPKYITYNVEVWDKLKNKSRDFFRIEGNPYWRIKKDAKIINTA